MKKTLSYLFIILALSFTIAACEKQGKMEEMGEKTDAMVEETGDKVKEMSEELQKKAKEAKEAVTE